MSSADVEDSSISLILIIRTFCQCFEEIKYGLINEVTLFDSRKEIKKYSLFSVLIEMLLMCHFVVNII